MKTTTDKHEFEPEEDNAERCAVCGNSRSWHPRDWR